MPKIILKTFKIAHKINDLENKTSSFWLYLKEFELGYNLGPKLNKTQISLIKRHSNQIVKILKQ
jgi:hypothetical protein